ncbi:MAG: hypothetical protein RLZZ337_788 [Bacteroidota bacterium]|jgi:hypothetical protein
MRIVAVALLILSLSAQAQYASVKVKIKKANTINKVYWETVYIYNQDTSYIYHAYPFHKTVSFDSVPTDTYHLALFSNLGKKIIKQLVVNEAKTYFVQFSEHKKFYTKYKGKTPFISQLNLGDTMSIYFNMEGCFGGYSGWADIYLNTDSYYIRYWQKDSIQNQEMDSTQMATLLKFEEGELKPRVNQFTCTNRYYYTIEYNRNFYTAKRDCYDLIKELTKE